MYYEIYVDSLLLINFVMNFCCLQLVNQTYLRSAAQRRVAAGAALGALFYLLPFLMEGPYRLKMAVGFVLSAVLMLQVTFRFRRVKDFLYALEKMLAFSILTGGTILLLMEKIPGMRRLLAGTAGILTVGILMFIIFSYLYERRKETPEIRRTVLVGKGAKITVNALWDSGNGLVEPISGRPVCILEKSVFDRLWREGRPEGFRAIPYHSIGRKRGILQGFPLPELWVEVNGVMKCCKNVYVGVSKEKISEGEGYKMILNPMIFQKKGREEEKWS